MDSILIAILLTILPSIELRGGLPVALIYAQNNGISTILIFFLILILNILLIFVIFFFLDHIHKILINYSWYEKIFKLYLNKTQKKIQKFEKRHAAWGELALFLFVAIPLPLTGAYTGAILSWLFKLDRKKSILAIAAGVTVAAIIIYAVTLGAFFVLQN